MPAAYSVRLSRTGERDLRALPKQEIVRLLRRLEQLAAQPRPSGAKKLKGEEAYRVRQGDYRIVYEVQDEARVVIVYRIRHRREVYR